MNSVGLRLTGRGTGGKGEEERREKRRTEGRREGREKEREGRGLGGEDRIRCSLTLGER